MSQSDKAAYYSALKASGVTFTKHYREYTTEELFEAYRQLPKPPDPIEDPEAEMPAFTLPDPQPAAALAPDPGPQPTGPPLAPRPENVLPGSHTLSVPEGEPIRVDENGLVWFQEEVPKPSYPKPRGRRVLKYVDSGVETKTVLNGDYIESFEVAGTRQAAGEIKITLPSYQVGLYKDPAMPFKIHVYGGQRGFNLFEVEDFYGGADMVPLECKRIYVENVLCYDIRTVVRAIQAEYRQQQLMGRIPQ